VIARLAEHPDRFFPDQTAWTAHLERLGIAALKVNPDPVLIHGSELRLTAVAEQF
jgi:hypothetical protein